MKKRILFICSEFPPGPGGIGNHGYNLIHTLQKKGFNTFTLTNLENASVDEAQKFAEEQDLKVKYVIRTPLIQLTRIAHAFRLYFTFKPDIIICSGMFSLWIGKLLQLISNKKFVAVIHGSEVDKKVAIQKKLTDWSLKAFTQIISVSNYTQSFIKDRYKWQNHSIIPNAIDIHFLQPFKEGSFVKLSGNPAILTVGNVTLRKGQQNLIKALPEIIKKLPQVHYHCVGLKTNVVENMKLAKELGVSNYITFHGKLALKDLMSAYKGCDIFAMTSEHLPDGDFEGFGIAILEANFFGKPAIGSKGCGIEDAIEESITGYKINPHQPQDIALAVENTILNYDRLSAECEIWAKKHNWDSIAEEYIKLF